jgi:hypothetical protein
VTTLLKPEPTFWPDIRPFRPGEQMNGNTLSDSPSSSITKPSRPDEESHEDAAALSVPLSSSHFAHASLTLRESSVCPVSSLDT